MYGKIQRDAVYKTRLLDFVCQEYALNAICFTEAKRGFYGETWQLEALDRKYFVKLDYSSLHKSVFRDSIAIVEHLCRNGINCIAKVINTISGALFFTTSFVYTSDSSFISAYIFFHLSIINQAKG